MPKTFSDIIYPVTQDEFFSDYLSKKILYINSSTNKFENLLPWEEFNSLLANQRLDYPRIRMAKEGQNIDRTEFINYNHRVRDVVVPQLDNSKINELLKDGATLIVDAIDECSPKIASICDTLENALYEKIQVNSYTTWGATHGFDLHWDDHDVFILQLKGKKSWKIYEMTRKFPMYRDYHELNSPPLENQVVWDGIMNEGDFLYIPRGWWHYAKSDGGLSQHLTVGFTNRTAIDFMKSVIDFLPLHDIFRMDLPKFSTLQDKSKYIHSLREIFNIYFTLEKMEEFYKSRLHKTNRTNFSFPYSVDNKILLNGSTLLKSTIPSLKNIETNTDGSITIHILDKSFTFHSEAKQIINKIIDNKICSVNELLVIGNASENTNRLFIHELLYNGILKIAD